METDAIRWCKTIKCLYDDIWIQLFTKYQNAMTYFRENLHSPTLLHELVIYLFTNGTTNVPWIIPESGPRDEKQTTYPSGLVLKQVKCDTLRKNKRQKASFAPSEGYRETWIHVYVELAWYVLIGSLASIMVLWGF